MVLPAKLVSHDMKYLFSVRCVEWIQIGIRMAMAECVRGTASYCPSNSDLVVCL